MMLFDDLKDNEWALVEALFCAEPAPSQAQWVLSPSPQDWLVAAGLAVVGVGHTPGLVGTLGTRSYVTDSAGW